MANRGDRHPMKTREAADDRWIVGVPAVAVKFDEVFKQTLDEIERVRPILVAGDRSSETARGAFTA